MSGNATRCPVPGCTAPLDEDNGDLCWRHRQMIKPALVRAIKAARREVRIAILPSELTYRKGEYAKAVNAAVAAAVKYETWVREHNAGKGDDHGPR